MTTATTAAATTTLGTGAEVSELAGEFGVEGVVEAHAFDIATALVRGLGARLTTRRAALAVSIRCLC